MPDGRLEFRVGDGEREAAVATVLPLMVRQWYRAVARYDAGRRSMTLEQQPLKPFPAGHTAARTEAQSHGIRPAAQGLPLLMAAEGTDAGAAHPTHFFNGKLEAPRLFARLATDAEIARIDAGTLAPTLSEGLIGAWDFGAGISTERAEDQGPHRMHGRLVNLPTRGVTGADWDGSVMSWPERPAHYAAVHFHEDDFADCGWQADFELALPAELPSGLYAARLTSGAIVERIVFFVNAPLGRHLHGLRQLALSHRQRRHGDEGRLLPRAQRGGALLQRAARPRAFDLRHPSRRLGSLLFLAP
jgi:N,N-dimethylformamidase